MEHLNRIFKNAVAGLGSNKKDTDFLRAGKVLEKAVNQFDKVHSVSKSSKLPRYVMTCQLSLKFLM